MDRVHRPLRLPLAAGVVGSLCITVGASQSSSPFTEHSPGAWPVKIDLWPSLSHENRRLLGATVVYLGLIVLLVSWYTIHRSTRAGRRPPLRHLVLTLAAWSTPLLFVGPLFSNDAYSYAAQGQLPAVGISPYRFGAAALGPGSFLNHVAPIWWHVVAPYGPVWERLVEGYVLVTGHSLVGTLVLLRITAAVSIAVLGWGIVALARATGHDPSAALVLGPLNPLILLTLLGGMHNDGLMIAFVVVGLVVAIRGRPVLGAFVCLLGAEVKAPAILAVIFIAWWSGKGRRPMAKASTIAGYGVLAAGSLAALSLLSGLGWGWIDAVVAPGKVVSWLDPVTAVGLALSHAAGALGIGAHAKAWTSGARIAGLIAAAVITVALLVRSDRRRGPEYLGWSLLALALLGPVVWPWYETWGILLIAAAANELAAWKRVVVIALSVLGCFADFPSAGVLGGGSPGFVVGCWAIVALVALGSLTYQFLRKTEPLGSPSATSP